MNKLLKTSELCNLLGVTRQCVYKWRRLDNPIPVAINNTGQGGKTIRYNYELVMEWLNTNGKEEKVLRQEEN
jgi:predicted site-specific integrase-resolvase